MKAQLERLRGGDRPIHAKWVAFDRQVHSDRARGGRRHELEQIEGAANLDSANDVALRLVRARRQPAAAAVDHVRFDGWLHRVRADARGL